MLTTQHGESQVFEKLTKADQMNLLNRPTLNFMVSTQPVLLQAQCMFDGYAIIKASFVCMQCMQGKAKRVVIMNSNQTFEGNEDLNNSCNIQHDIDSLRPLSMSSTENQGTG